MVLLAKLKSSLQKIYGSHHDMVNHYDTDICVTNDHGDVPFAECIWLHMFLIEQALHRLSFGQTM
jgi:hypothetical protein